MRVVADGAGQVVETLDYSAFGEPLFTESVSTHLFAGERYDEITGLYYLRARSYSPELGRFLSRDVWAYDYQNPFELNRYVYGVNNPVRFTDPSGYMSEYTQLMRISLSTAVGTGIGSIAGMASSSIFYIVATTGACGDNIRNWALSLSQSQFRNYIFQSAMIGGVMGGMSGLMAAFSPASASSFAKVFSLAGMGISGFDILRNGFNACNMTGLLLSAGGGLSGGLSPQTVNLTLDNFDILMGTNINSSSAALSLSVPTTVTITWTSAGTATITNVLMFSMAGGDGGGTQDNNYSSGNELHSDRDNRTTTIKNNSDDPYPIKMDPRTGRPIPFPDGDPERIPIEARVSWDSRTERNNFIREWYRRGYPDIPNWQDYDLHHILPR